MRGTGNRLRTRLIGRLLAVAFLSPSGIAVRAEDNVGAVLSETASRVVVARTIAALCDERGIAGEGARRDALASWSQRNDIADYDAVIAALAQKSEPLRKEIAANDERARQQLAKALDGDPSTCGNLAAFLADEKYEIKRSVRSLRRLARNLDLDVVATQPDAKPAPAKLMGLAQFSALAEKEMSTVGSFEGAQDDRHLREAREEHLKTYLTQQGVVAGYGRVVEDDRLREWRGPRQSRFSLSCRNFRDDTHEARMKASIGKDMVVVGKPRTVLDGDNARVTLGDCLLFTLAETGETIAETDDEAGLVHRPPDMAEVYAGADKGIAADDVDRVLYVAEFDNRMDGFGNGYTHRQEDVYVLLTDGTAYRHAWSFPFSDLNVAVSREREPTRWLTWSKGWTGSITLMQGDKEIDVSKAQELAPMPEDTRLDHSYYFLNVGMGGSRQDRSYVFRPDGTVTHARGGFVAGNFGTSYIVATNNRDDKVSSSYRFDGYSLILTRPEGDERHFFAVFENADTGDPEDVIVGGEIYWTRKAEAD